MANPQRGGEPLSLNGGPLGDLHFFWSQDRYAHRWQFGSEKEEALHAIESVESDSQAVWPTSPPLQQIHYQEFADGRQVVFGVGMAGRGHWSASFTLVPDLRCWIVELACRSAVEPGELRSTYRLGDRWSEQGEASAAIAACYTADALQLQLEAIPPASTARFTDQVLNIRPIQIEKAATNQWAFRLRVTPAA
jgi:hypothetical protein